MLRELKWQIPGERLAARYNWCQGLVPGRGPAVEKHCHNQSQVQLAVWDLTISIFWSPYKGPDCQVICNRYQCKASCYLLATDSWHQYHLNCDTSLYATVGQTVKREWWLCGVWCVTSATMCHVYIKVRVKLLASECLLCLETSWYT